MKPSKFFALLLCSTLSIPFTASAQKGGGKGKGKGKGGRVPFSVLEERAIAEGFTGVTTDGEPIAGLFPIRSTEVSTEPVKQAAENFLKSLTEEQRKESTFPADDSEWRKWANQHSYERQGVSFDEMNEKQRGLAFALLESALSAHGLKTSRNIMRLNETIAELKNDWQGYGEGKYHLTVMGEPSEKEPWGWQLDGHHLVINYFVLGDQVVMTPLFIGSEPVWADSGKYEGTIVMQKEQADGLAFMRSLTEPQQAEARIQNEKGPFNALAEAFKDNLIVAYSGIKADKLDAAQKKGLLDLIGVFVGYRKEGHAEIRMEEVAAHIDETYFAWIGEIDDDAVFYYRIQSPVIYIEFDHQRPIGLERTGVPSRNHIHAVVRTPNGNDYGKSLLQQHYQNHKH